MKQQSLAFPAFSSILIILILNVAKNWKEFPRQKNITRQRSSISLAEDLLVESEVETVGEWRESIWGEIPWGGETNVRGIPPE